MSAHDESKPAAGHVHHEHDCRAYLDSLSEYVDGVLSEDLCHELETHMAECENCRVVVNTLSKTITLYHQLPALEMPDAVRERLYKVLKIDDLRRSPENERTSQENAGL